MNFIDQLTDKVHQVFEARHEVRENALALTRQLTRKAAHEVYYSGYTQDAIKEYVEARLTINMVSKEDLPQPDELGVLYATYLKGLAETIGELRRRCLDILRQGYSDEAERMLDLMDEIYSMLVTVDYPDAITHGLRRQTDQVRGIIERTRADLTLSLREERLQQALKDFEDRFNNGKG
jgi:translin